MKRRISIILGVSAMCIVSNGETFMRVVQTDGDVVKFEVDKVKEVDFEESAQDTITYQERYYVDLGLPSGTLWAVYNVGAENYNEYGDYFAWGETKPKASYDWITYKWCKTFVDDLDSLMSITRYNFGNKYSSVIDNRSKLLPQDDAATVNWGPEWRMPTKEEFRELRDFCTWNWYNAEGVPGFWVISPEGKGKQIFLPAAGNYWGDSLATIHFGSNCLFWTSTLFEEDESRAYCANCVNVRSYAVDYPNEGNFDLSDKVRENGFSVRPVYYKKRDEIEK